MNAREEDMQITIAEYMKWKHPDVKFTQTMGGVRLTMKQAVKAKKMGYGKGVPDLIFFKACHGYHGLAIELKRDKRSKISTEQKEWCEYMNNEGYFACISTGVDETLELIDRYLN
jgi:hypothetical protein